MGVAWWQPLTGAALWNPCATASQDDLSFSGPRDFCEPVVNSPYVVTERKVLPLTWLERWIVTVGSMFPLLRRLSHWWAALYQNTMSIVRGQSPGRVASVILTITGGVWRERAWVDGHPEWRSPALCLPLSLTVHCPYRRILLSFPTLLPSLTSPRAEWAFKVFPGHVLFLSVFHDRT